MEQYIWRELSIEKDEYAIVGDVAMCGDEPLFICSGDIPYPKEISEVLRTTDATRIFRFQKLMVCNKCGQIDIGQTGEYPCPECGLPTTWDEDIKGVFKEAHP